MGKQVNQLVQIPDENITPTAVLLVYDQVAQDSKKISLSQLDLTGGSGDATLTSEIIITDPVGPDQFKNQVYAIGTPLETIITQMLVSYQQPTIDIGNVLPGTAESGVSTYNVSSLNVTKTDADNINTGIPGTVVFNDPTNQNDANRNITWNASSSQTLNFSPITGTYEVTSGTPGAAGTPKNATYRITASGTDTQNGTFDDSDTINVQYRTYFGATSTRFNGSNGASILPELGGALNNDSKRVVTTTAENNDNSKHTVFVFPECHFTNGSTQQITSIKQGATEVIGAFTDQGTQIVNGVRYLFFESNANGAFAAGINLEVS